MNKTLPLNPAHSATVTQIHERLQVLCPLELEITDDSALHAGHAGARGGGGHYRVRVVSAQFESLNTVARHRLIYAALTGLMGSAIHALAIEALAPNQSLTAR